LRPKLQIYLSYLLIFCLLVFISNQVMHAKPVKVGVSIWTGWMPIYLMEGDVLEAGANPATADIFISYEVIDDA